MYLIRRTILKLIFGPSRKREEDETRLLMVNPSRAGCGGIVALFWLFVWNLFLVHMVRQEFGKRDIHEILNSPEMLGWSLSVAADLGMLCYLVWCFAGREKLRIEGSTIHYVKSAIVRLRHRRMSALDVTHVELVRLPKSQWQVVQITARSNRIHFGAGSDDSQLVRDALQIRQRIEKAAHRPLPAASHLTEFDAANNTQVNRNMSAALAAVGAESLQAAWADPQQRKALIGKMTELAAADARPKTPEPESAVTRRIQWAVGVFVIALSGIFVIAFSVVWIFATIGLTVQMIQNRRWGLVFIVALFWASSAVFAFALYGWAKQAVKGFWKWLTKLGSRQAR